MLPSSYSDWVYLRRLLIAAGVVGLVYFVWTISGILLLAFAAVLIAVLLFGAADLISSRLPLGHGISLALAIAAALLFLASFATSFGTQLKDQLVEVFTRAPQALDAVGRQFGIEDAALSVQQSLTSNPGGQVLSRAASIGYTFLGGVADLVLVVVASIYLAADPALYRGGVLKLFPSAHHRRIADAMDGTATALRLWFLGQLVAMVLVGALLGLAYWLIGLPLPIGLGVVAGLTNFVPLVGPILGAVPALLFSFTEGTSSVLWTVAAILSVQQIEGNIITPLVQRRAVSVPPALILFSIATFGALFGWLGIVLAVPLTVTCMVLTQKLWIREVLGERAAVAGE
jgi:predicted PurR-regulated permease PerM